MEKKPNTKCPICEKWHWKKDADPRVKRNYCDTCLNRIQDSDFDIDLLEEYGAGSDKVFKTNKGRVA